MRDAVTTQREQDEATQERDRERFIAQLRRILGDVWFAELGIVARYQQKGLHLQWCGCFTYQGRPYLITGGDDHWMCWLDDPAIQWGCSHCSGNRRKFRQSLIEFLAGIEQGVVPSILHFGL